MNNFLGRGRGSVRAVRSGVVLPKITNASASQVRKKESSDRNQRVSALLQFPNLTQYRYFLLRGVARSSTRRTHSPSSCSTALSGRRFSCPQTRWIRARSTTSPSLSTTPPRRRGRPTPKRWSSGWRAKAPRGEGV